MKWSMEPLVVGRVIGDVLDMFSPCVDMVVTYPARQVNNGCEINQAAVGEPPHVKVGRYEFQNDDLFTLIMTDPDAPSPSDPTSREYVQWIVSDIPAGTNASYGREILPYEPQGRLIGIHRCIFVLFKQNGPLRSMMPPMERCNFKTRDFSAEYHLGLPVAAVYYNCQKQTGSRRR